MISLNYLIFETQNKQRQLRSAPFSSLGVRTRVTKSQCPAVGSHPVLSVGTVFVQRPNMEACAAESLLDDSQNAVFPLLRNKYQEKKNMFNALEWFIVVYIKFISIFSKFSQLQVVSMLVTSSHPMVFDR